MSGSGNVAVVAALIAAAAAIASAAISAVTVRSATKRSSAQKIAEFRKEWLDNLRSHLAEFHASTNRMLALKQMHKDAPMDYSEQLEVWMKAFSEASYVELMLNSNEEAHENLIAEMHRILAPDQERLNLKQFRQLAREVLKTEWDRLKIEVQST